MSQDKRDLKPVKYDVAFSIKRNEWSDELRFALRSLQFINVRNVWIFGWKPYWVRNVHHVPVRDIKGNKWADIHYKTRAIIDCDDLPDTVLHMYDDLYFLDDRYYNQPLPNWYWKTTEDRRVPERHKAHRYRSIITTAGDMLRDYGHTDRNYAIHTPFAFNRSEVPTEEVDRWYHDNDTDFYEKPISWWTIAGNTSSAAQVELPGDVKVNRHTSLDTALSRGCGLLSTDNSLLRKSGSLDYLTDVLNSKSPYER